MKMSLLITRRNNARRGAALLECALVLPVFLLVIFASLDLGLAVFRHNALSAAARYLARESALHGALAPPQRTTWGPTLFTGTGADASEPSQAIQRYLATFNAAAVQVQINWPDGDTQPDDRVQATVNYAQTSLLGSLFGYGTLNLQATSTMHILH